MRKTAIVVALALTALRAVPAVACGGLVAPDGDVRLGRATTLVAWHAGVEHYLTSFAYQGDVANLGWIVPLPAVPTAVKEGGRWTLQRLEREFTPVQRFAASAIADSAAAPAEVIQQLQVEALDVTVLRGSGHSVIDWCGQNGFSLPPETRAHLLAYAKASPIFLAARYDTATAHARHQLEGDGVPLLITMDLPHPWVPLEVLANDDTRVQAELYLLTDQALRVDDGSFLPGSPVGRQLVGAPGFTVAAQEPMSAALQRDLAGDRNMEWVPANGWVTRLSLDAPGTTVAYDLGVTSDGLIRLAQFAGPPMAIGGGDTHGVPFSPGVDGVEVALIAALGTLLLTSAGAIMWWRRRAAQRLAISSTAGASAMGMPSTRE